MVSEMCIVVFFFKQKTAYEIMPSLVGSENVYKRQVIHTALQETPDITTYSIGTEPNRRTVVAYSRGEHR